MKKITTLLLFATFTLQGICQQSTDLPGLTIPQGSQRGEVIQTIGLSTISIVYHSPAVKERTIWGGLVPYDKVWRCGANENTTIEFSHDSKFEGQPVPAGKYGLHMIPGEQDWVIILSSNSSSWGSYFYKKSEDVVRVTVKPTLKDEHTEWLNYGFMNRKSESSVAYLEWEKLRVPFEISVDVKELVFQNIKKELRSLAAYSKTGHLQAAQYCMQNNFHHDEALVWIERSIRFHPSFASSSTKAGLLRQIGRTEEAKEIMDDIADSGSEAELNSYGYQLLALKEFNEALVIFEKVVKKYPKSWNAHDSLAEAYGMNGDKEKSIKYYKLALKKNPPEDQVARINALLN